MENNLVKSKNGLKLFVIFIGVLMWFSLAYYSYVFANWQMHFFIKSSIVVKCIILFFFFVIGLTGLHKIIYAMVFITLNHKYGNFLYSSAGILAGILAYFFYLNYYPIFYDSANVRALLSTTDENSISKALSLSSYIILMFIFISNYCFFPIFNRKK